VNPNFLALNANSSKTVKAMDGDMHCRERLLGFYFVWTTVRLFRLFHVHHFCVSALSVQYSFLANTEARVKGTIVK